MISVEQWAEIRRLHRVEGMSIRDISHHLGKARETVAAVPVVVEGWELKLRASCPSQLKDSLTQ